MRDYIQITPSERFALLCFFLSHTVCLYGVTITNEYVLAFFKVVMCSASLSVSQTSLFPRNTKDFQVLQVTTGTHEETITHFSLYYSANYS